MAKHVPLIKMPAYHGKYGYRPNYMDFLLLDNTQHHKMTSRIAHLHIFLVQLNAHLSITRFLQVLYCKHPPDVSICKDLLWCNWTYPLLRAICNFWTPSASFIMIVSSCILSVTVLALGFHHIVSMVRVHISHHLEFAAGFSSELTVFYKRCGRNLYNWGSSTYCLIITGWSSTIKHDHTVIITIVFEGPAATSCVARRSSGKLPRLPLDQYTNHGLQPAPKEYGPDFRIGLL